MHDLFSWIKIETLIVLIFPTYSCSNREQLIAFPFCQRYDNRLYVFMNERIKERFAFFALGNNRFNERKI